METKQKFELIMWDDVRRDMKYPPEDNNNGYIFGLNSLSDDGFEIIDVEWFTTEKARQIKLNEYN